MTRQWFALGALLCVLIACTVRGRPSLPPAGPSEGAQASSPTGLPAADPDSAKEEPVEPVAAAVIVARTKTAPSPATPSSGSASLPAPPPPSAHGAPRQGVWVRVGLRTDLEQVHLPCCDDALTVEIPVAASGEPTQVAVVAPLTVTPAAQAVLPATFRLQVAALKDEGQAWEAAQRLGAHLAEPADAHFDATVGLYRVRVGSYASRVEAEVARRLLAARQAAEAWIVEEGGGLRQPALNVTQGENSWKVAGRWLALDAVNGGGIRVAGQRFRGRILVFLNDRGSLNLINELSLEDYLRGVVPKEMGPEIFDRIEALKAQAVAARTYTLHNLGEFSAEGYDICATPRCHVYGGMGSEHPVSDRAVAETAGQVLIYQGKPIDALYTSTCGGHTEDVSVVFPLKDYPYLVGVPCYESGAQKVRGSLSRGTAFPLGMTRKLLPRSRALHSAPAFAARVDQLATLAGLPAGERTLESLQRREVRRLIATVFDLVFDSRLFAADIDLAHLLDNPPADWDGEDLRRAEYLAASGLMEGSAQRPLAENDRERLLLRLAEMLAVLRQEAVSFVAVEGRDLTVRSVSGGPDDGDRLIHLPAELATFRRQGDGWSAGNLTLVAGDRLRLWWHGEELVGLLQEADADGVSLDRRSKWSAWTRYRSDDRLAELVEERYPGLGFDRFEILERGPSGRVAKILLYGAHGVTQEVDGLAVRWVLDLPETFFTAQRVNQRGRPAGWTFHGRGWGHGVGMCQVGAFGMAGRSLSYRDILSHYYHGARLVRVRDAAG